MEKEEDTRDRKTEIEGEEETETDLANIDFF